MDALTTIPTPFYESAHSLWYPSTTSQAYTFLPSNPPNHSTCSNNNNNNLQSSQTQHQQQQQAQQQAQQQQAQAQQQHRHSTRTASRTFLTHLRADEQAITLRRGNIRRFGAGWLKPPGVAKTMQGFWDELAEREEADAAALREATLAEAQAAAEALAGGDGDADEDGDGEGGRAERDLDDDIPEGEGEGDWEEEEEDDDDDYDEGGGDGEDDGGLLPMHEVDGDFGPDGIRMSVIGDGAGDVMGVDLDGDVPEAGSYQHTDTDVEDSSSEEGDTDGNGGGNSSGRMARSSIGMASVVGFAGLASSPIQPIGRRQR